MHVQGRQGQQDRAMSANVGAGAPCRAAHAAQRCSSGRWPAPLSPAAAAAPPAMRRQPRRRAARKRAGRGARLPHVGFLHFPVRYRCLFSEPRVPPLDALLHPAAPRSRAVSAAAPTAAAAPRRRPRRRGRGNGWARTSWTNPAMRFFCHFLSDPLRPSHSCAPPLSVRRFTGRRARGRRCAGGGAGPGPQIPPWCRPRAGW